MKQSFAPETPYITHDNLLTLTELKERAEAMTALGKAIVSLTDKELRRVPLEGAVREAVLEARRLDQYAARKRQLRFIGRLLRGIDVEPLEKALADIRASVPYVPPQLLRARAWVQQLIDGDQETVGAYLQEAPNAERTRLSQLLRQYAKDVKTITDEQPDRTAREARARKTLLAYVQATLTEA